jgi:hypothetical protein
VETVSSSSLSRCAIAANAAPLERMKPLIVLALAAALLASSAYAGDETHPEKCPCVDTLCNNACMSPAGPDVIAALRKRFPDLQDGEIIVFDLRQLPARHRASPYDVSFYTTKWHMSCKLKLNPIRLGSCGIVHG